MTDKKGFVERHVLDADDMAVRNFDDLVYEKERKAMRQRLFDLLGVKDRRLIRIVDRRILKMFVFFLCTV